jgi:hypothetical protein
MSSSPSGEIKVLLTPSSQSGRVKRPVVVTVTVVPLVVACATTPESPTFEPDLYELEPVDMDHINTLRMNGQPFGRNKRHRISL